MKKRQSESPDFADQACEHDLVDTILMSGPGTEGVFDDLRQRYERKVESQEIQLMSGGSPKAPLHTDDDLGHQGELSIDTSQPRRPQAPLHWFTWSLVVASFALLFATASVAFMVLS